MGGSGSSGLSQGDLDNALHKQNMQAQANARKQAAAQTAKQAKLLKEMQEKSEQNMIKAEARAAEERERIRLSERKEREKLQIIQAEKMRKLREKQDREMKLQQEKIEKIRIEQEKEKKDKEKLQDEMEEMKKELEDEKDPKKFAELQKRNHSRFIEKLSVSRNLIDKYDYNGKNIGIIGPTSVGKTTLMRVLTRHKIGVVDKGESTIKISKIAECHINNDGQIIYDGPEKCYYDDNVDNIEIIDEDDINIEDDIKINVEGIIETRNNKVLNIWDTPGLNDKMCYFKPEILAHFNSLQLVILMYSNTPLSILHALLTLKALGIPFILVKSKVDMYDEDAFGDDESSLDECIRKDEDSLCGSIGYKENIYKISAANTYKNEKLIMEGKPRKYEEFDYRQIRNMIIN